MLFYQFQGQKTVVENHDIFDLDGPVVHVYEMWSPYTCMFAKRYSISIEKTV